MKEKHSKYFWPGMLLILLLAVCWLMEMVIPVITDASTAMNTAVENYLMLLYYIAFWLRAIILIVLTIYWIFRLVLVLFGKKPLSGRQVNKLAARKVKSYVKNNYSFLRFSGNVSNNLKNALNSSDNRKMVKEPLSTFPGYAADYMKNNDVKVILAIETNGIVQCIWSAKDIDPNGLPTTCSTKNLEIACEEIGASTLIYCYCPEQSDEQAASHVDPSCYDWANAHGYNWIEFSCQDGVYREERRIISDYFASPHYSVSDIIDRSGVSPELDYMLQKEYWGINVYSKFILSKYVIISLAAFLALIFLSNGIAFVAGREKSESEQLDVISGLYTALSSSSDNIIEGDTITFGEYEQDGDLNNGNEVIEWIVLDINDDEYLLISRNILFCHAYDSTKEATNSWIESTLYTYLNSEFYADAFSDDDHSKMLSVWSDEEGRVSTLNVNSIDEYCIPDALIATPTAFAISQNVHVYPSGGCLWWTSTKVDDNKAVCVNDRGRLYLESGIDITLDNIGVRPVIRVCMS